MMKVKGNDLESRVQRLERENRTLKSVGLGLALLALLVVGTAQAPGRAPKVEASEIVLKDDAGTVRARFALDSVGASSSCSTDTATGRSPLPPTSDRAASW